MPKLSSDILPCPKCHKTGKVELCDVFGSPSDMEAYVHCTDDVCGFYVPDVRGLKTSEIAEKLLKIRAINKWNKVAMEQEEANNVV